MITREMLRVLVNNLVFADKIDRQYDDAFAKTGAKVGNTLNIRKPVRFVRTDGQGLQLQDATETSVPLVLTTQGQRAFTFTSQDLTLSIDDYSKRFISPAVASLANQVDFDGLQLYKQVWNLVGTPGTVPNAVLTYLTAGVYLDNNAAPVDGERALCVNPLMQATIVNALTGFFNPQRTISEQYEKGQMTKDTLGFDWYMAPNVKTVPASGATSIAVQGFTAADALNVGDVFTIGFASYGGAAATTPVYGVNPQNFQSTGTAQQFVVTSPFVADGSGNGTINFAPAIATSGPFQTVNQLPTTGTTNGLINIYGASAKSTPQGLAFHRDAFTMASADL